MIDKYYVVWDERYGNNHQVEVNYIHNYHIQDYNNSVKNNGETISEPWMPVGVSVETALKLAHLWNSRFAHIRDRRFFITKEEAITYQKIINEKDFQHKLFPEKGGMLI